MRSFVAVSFAVAGSLFVLGCAGADPAEDAEEIGVTEAPLVWTNGDMPSVFWSPSTQAALRTMSQSSLLDQRGALANTQLATTPWGQTVLGYVVGCALPAGVTVYSQQSGTSFAGAMGLAPEWASSSLGRPASQRWVTACLLQTLNGLGVHVPIRLTGSNPALADDGDPQAATYTVPDDTAFGNVFLPGGPQAYLCTNLGNVDACGLQVSLFSLLRVCGLAPLCGATLLGSCSASCTAGDSGPTCQDPGGNTYAEAISSQLQPTLSITLFPACGAAH